MEDGFSLKVLLGVRILRPIDFAKRTITWLLDFPWSHHYLPYFQYFRFLQFGARYAIICQFKRDWWIILWSRKLQFSQGLQNSDEEFSEVKLVSPIKR